MLAAVTRSPKVIVVDERPAPGQARPGEVVVRPEVVGICGSDFHIYDGDIAALSGNQDFYPRVQGHELSAVVDDVGDGVSGLAAGDRVAVWPLSPCGRCYPCRIGRPNVCPSFRLVGVHADGGLQQQLALPASQVFGVGDLDAACAAFVEPTSVAVHAVRRGRVTGGEQVVVFGAGPIGLATVLAAVAAGARVLVVDPVAARRDLAAAAGAEQTVWDDPQGVLAAARDWTAGDGPAVAVDTTGHPGVLAQCVELVANAGRVVVVGMSGPPAPLRSGAFPEKEIDVLGSSCQTAAAFQEAIRLVADRRETVGRLFTHRFPLTRAKEAFDLAVGQPDEVMKVLVEVGN